MFPNPGASPKPNPKPSAFLETIIAYLMPYFIDAAADLQDARTEVIDTLAAYATRTRAEILQAAQLVAIGMTTLDVLAQAGTAEMSTAMRIRHRGCANGLTRATVNIEKALQRRLASAVPDTEETPADPADRVPAAPTQGSPRRPASEDRRRTPAKPHPGAQAERDLPIWAGAMIDTLKQIGVPVQIAPNG